MLQEKECKGNGIQYIKKHLSLESLNMSKPQQDSTTLFCFLFHHGGFLGSFFLSAVPSLSMATSWWSLLRSSFPGEDDAFHVAICRKALPKLLDAGQGFGGMELLSLLLLPLPQTAGTLLGHLGPWDMIYYWVNYNNSLS